MNINIKATKTTLTPAITNAINDKISVIEDFLKPENKVHVECAIDKSHKNGEIFRVEVTIKPNGIYADATGSDFYQALDSVIPKIKEQLSKNKDKKISLRRKLGAKAKGR